MPVHSYYCWWALAESNRRHPDFKGLAAAGGDSRAFKHFKKLGVAATCALVGSSRVFVEAHGCNFGHSFTAQACAMKDSTMHGNVSSVVCSRPLRFVGKQIAPVQP